MYYHFSLDHHPSYVLFRPSFSWQATTWPAARCQLWDTLWPITKTAIWGIWGTNDLTHRLVQLSVSVICPLLWALDAIQGRFTWNCIDDLDSLCHRAPFHHFHNIHQWWSNVHVPRCHPAWSWHTRPQWPRIYNSCPTCKCMSNHSWL